MPRVTDGVVSIADAVGPDAAAIEALLAELGLGGRLILEGSRIEATGPGSFGPVFHAEILVTTDWASRMMDAMYPPVRATSP